MGGKQGCQLGKDGLHAVAASRQLLSRQKDSRGHGPGPGVVASYKVRKIGY